MPPDIETEKNKGPPAEIVLSNNEEIPPQETDRPSSHHRRRASRKKKEHTDDDDGDKMLSKEESEHRRNVYKRKGDYSFRSGKYAKAISRYTRALDYDPNNHVLLSNRSAAHLARGHAEKALEDARACVIANPNDCRGHSRLAVALQRMDLWEPAMESYQRVLDIDPDNQVAHRGIEVCQVEMNLQNLSREELCRELQEHEEELRLQRNSSRDRLIPETSNRQLKDNENPRKATSHRKTDDLPRSSSQRANQDFAQKGPSHHRRKTVSSSLRLPAHSLTKPEETKPKQQQQYPDEPGEANQQEHVDDVGSNSTGRRSQYSGMSELCKQLRVLQATIQSQEDQVDRLGRQLKIMSELKGVSVSELRSSLKMACQEEAHAELVDQIASLRSQLGAMTLLNSSEVGSTAFERECYEKNIATLQLRIGELEENEDAFRKEIGELYRSLSEQTSKASQLSSTCDSQKKQLVDLLKNVTLVKTSSSSRSQKWSVMACEPKEAPGSVAATDSEASVLTTTDNISSTSTTESQLAERVRNSELQLKMERDRAKLLEIQVEAREVESQLQKKQFKSRIHFQEDRISDLEHQLAMLMNGRSFSVSSLSNSTPPFPHPIPFPPPIKEVEEYQPPQAVPHMQKEIIPELEDSPPPEMEMGEATKTSNVKASTKQNAPQDDVTLDSQKIASGYLLKRDSKHHLLLKTVWKKRYFVLQRTLGTYQLTYSDGPHSTKIKGTIASITTGLSTVQATTEFAPKQPHVFVLRVNPHDDNAPVLYAATASAQDLQKWLLALTTATAGGQQEGKDAEQVEANKTNDQHEFDTRSIPPRVGSQLFQDETDPEMVKRMQKLERILQKYEHN